MLTSLRQNLALEAIVPALAAGGVFTFLLAALGGARFGARLAGAAIGLGFLSAYAVILGLPGFPPSIAQPAIQKLPFVVGALIVLGILADLARVGAAPPLAGLVVGAGVLWLSWRGVFAFQLQPIAVTGVSAIAAGLLLPRLEAPAESAADGAAAAIAAASALAAVAFLGGSGSLAQLCGALAAAAGGFALWNWPRPRHAFGAAAIFASGGTLIVIAAQLALFEDANRASLLLALAALLAPTVAAVLPGAGGPVLLRPFLVGAIAAVPAFAAWALALGL